MSANNSGFSETLRRCWANLGIPIELITDRELPVFAEARTLEIAETGTDGRQHFLVPEAAAAWLAMQTAARVDTVDIYIVSAHRSIERQIEIIGHKLEAGQSIEQIFAVSAPPGCSEHHTGRAIDIGTPDSPALERSFELTPAWRWLTANAGKFGFTLTYPEGNRWGFDYEPWHWCFGETSIDR